MCFGEGSVLVSAGEPEASVSGSLLVGAAVPGACASAGGETTGLGRMGRAGILAGAGGAARGSGAAIPDGGVRGGSFVFLGAEWGTAAVEPALSAEAACPADADAACPADADAASPVDADAPGCVPVGLSPGLADAGPPELSAPGATLDSGGPEAPVARRRGCVLVDRSDGGCAHNIGFVVSAGPGGGTGGRR
jgi:hypothetical protein